MVHTKHCTSHNPLNDGWYALTGGCLVQNGGDSYTYHVSPPNDVFKSFGKNKKIVKEEYQAVFHTLEELYEEGSLVDISVSTILYKEGLSLVANKKFAQYPAGENLAKYLIVPDSLGSDFYMRSKYNSPEKYG